MTANAAGKKAKTETVVETVTMKDGRVVEFAGKRKLLKASVLNGDGSIVVNLDFRNKETRQFVLPAAMVAKFAAHGAEQKLGDEVAGVEDVDDQVIAIDQLIERLNKGEWGQKRDASGLAGTSVLVQALVQLTGKTAEATKEFLKDKSQAEKVALRNSPRVKPLVDAIEAAKAAKNVGKKGAVDADALLAGLDAIA